MKQGEDIPSLGGLGYQAQRFLESGSKMSDILLAVDRKNRPVILKIASVNQRARADVNRQAIKTTIEWLRQLGAYRGIIRLRPIVFKGASWGSAWFSPPSYCGTLQQWPGQPEFLVMDYVPGGSLRDFVGDKRLDIGLALWIAHYLARALAYIHQRSCVHRDIKPENILFRVLPAANANVNQMMPILIDFGVAGHIGERKLVSGSRLWMAPELQEAYERYPLPVDPAWDLYALGLILCYMLTGRRPRQKNYDFYNYELFREQTFAVLDREGAAIGSTRRAVIPRLKQLIGRTLEKDPINRPSAAEFAAETGLLLAQMGRPLPARELWMMRLEQSSRLMNQRLLGVVAMVILAMVLLLGAALAARWDILSPGTHASSAVNASVATLTPPVPLPRRSSAALPPALTVAPLTPTATRPAPTRIPWTPPATQPPSSLVPLTPAPAATELLPMPSSTPDKQSDPRQG